MKERYIPFHDRFTPLMRQGVKTQTARTKKYGKPGDIFYWEGDIYVLTEVFENLLSNIADRDYQAEGFKTPHEFKHFWGKIHYHKGYQGEQLVWVHRFKRLERP